MTIAPPSPLLTGPLVPASPSNANAATASAGDFQSFLKLLTAQLSNQDPLSPLDSTEFVAQLASFSSVEQLVGVNGRLDSLVRHIGAQGITGIADWIGRDTSLSDGSFRATGDAISFIAPPATAGETIEAVIRTPAGTVLRRLAVFGDANGRARWDGRDSAGNLVAPQDLVLELTSTASGQAALTVAGEVLARITGVSGNGDGVTIDLSDGRSVAPEALSRLQLPLPSG